MLDSFNFVHDNTDPELKIPCIGFGMVWDSSYPLFFGRKKKF